MKSGTTTEELFSALDSRTRDEAVRLAAHLQAGGEESASLLAAAREAGIEDRFLREAVESLGTRVVQTEEVFVAPVEKGAGLNGPLLLVMTFLEIPLCWSYLSSTTVGRFFFPYLFVLAVVALAVGLTLPPQRPRWKAAQSVFVVASGIVSLLVAFRYLNGSRLPMEMVVARAALLAIALPGIAYAGALTSSMLKSVRGAMPQSLSK